MNIISLLLYRVILVITNKTEGKARKGHRKQAYLKAAIYEIQHQVLDELF